MLKNELVGLALVLALKRCLSELKSTKLHVCNKDRAKRNPELHNIN